MAFLAATPADIFCLVRRAAAGGAAAALGGAVFLALIWKDRCVMLWRR